MVLAVAVATVAGIALAALGFVLAGRRRRRAAQANTGLVPMTTTRWLRLLAARGYLRFRWRRVRYRTGQSRDHRDP